MDRRYYLDRWSDETVPCDTTLESWALWLSAPDRNWDRPEAARHGDTFPATVLEFEDDILATRTAEGWIFSRPIGDVDFLAVRWHEGGGWCAENVIWGEDMEKALLEWFAEGDFACDDIEHIAVGRYLPKIILTYHADPSPRLSVSTTQ